MSAPTYHGVYVYFPQPPNHPPPVVVGVGVVVAGSAAVGAAVQVVAEIHLQKAHLKTKQKRVWA